MSLRVYNTLSGKKEEFVPQVPGKVSMYVCGVTVYDHCHIGHARANVVFDVIYRYLRHSGFDVTYVRNYTDVDDKIINRANREGVDFREITERFIAEFDRDMTMLACATPTYQPKATEHIEDIIRIVQTLIDRGFAYQGDGDVYFNVEKYDDYLKLSKRNLEDMKAGARIEVDERKAHPMDFVLWKGAKPGEPSWDSPWGKGRPGWHIECSAMSMRFLGETIDIHGGGKDLVFPHHENEIAQSEAATGRPFVKYWLHNGFVNINSEKMSKSLGNFFTIKEVLERYDAEALRFFLITAQYRSPLDFSDQNVKEAESGLDRIYTALARIDEILAGVSADLLVVNEKSLKDGERELLEKAESFPARFREAMDDDFNTAQVLGNIFDLVRAVNRVLAEGGKISANLRAILAKTRSALDEAGEVLGIFRTRPEDYLENAKERKLEELGISREEIEALIEERTAARKARDFARSDEIRDALLDRNIVLLDSPQGTTWKIK
ncbi:MAG TPA: cysteine--tRNA ligase [Geobacteraceae bacterium]|nr:cysteine--tRNA ligase [Geobacteraceae bacterium]